MPPPCQFKIKLLIVSILALWTYKGGRGVVALLNLETGPLYLCEHLIPPPYTKWLVANVTKRRYSVSPEWMTERRLRVLLSGNGKALMLIGGVVQVRLTEENIPVGQFEPDAVRLYDCPPGRKNTAYRQEVEHKINTAFFWRVPPNLSSRIHNFTVFATFIKDARTFWPVSIEVTKFEYTQSEIEKLSMFDVEYRETTAASSQDSDY